ncbi:MAG: hypothetical protein K6B74_10105 [Ruminococcus sp.]|nr:hypothetical protein [Ruminococcus sp.]
MDRTAKIRITVFVIILLILAYFSAGYAFSLYSSGAHAHIVDTENMDVQIDGSDFTPLFQLFGYGINSLLGFLLYGIYAIVIILISLLLIIPFRLISLRKTTVLSAAEYRLSKLILLAVTVLSVLVGLILTHGTYIMPLLIYTAIWAVLALLIYILGISKRVVKY